MKNIHLALIGGSGFYSLFNNCDYIKVETPYGPPSDKIAIGKIANKQIAFLPRHQKDHDFPPHKIPFRANIWALASLGVKKVLAVTACGSLQKHIKPGDFVVLDQFFDRTKNRQDTFFDGPVATHISTANSYCPTLSSLIYKIGKQQNLSIHPQGTVVVIQGPRFSSGAESHFFTKAGWHVINMTQYPEVVLAREKEMCYSACALVTDYDAGLVAEGGVKPVSAKEVGRVFKKNVEKAKKLMVEVIKNVDKDAGCGCQESLKGARLE